MWIYHIFNKILKNLFFAIQIYVSNRLLYPTWAFGPNLLKVFKPFA